jgi:hypothetical protein
MGKHAENSKYVSFWISQETFQNLEEIRRSLEMNRSDLYRRLLKGNLEKLREFQRRVAQEN